MNYKITYTLGSIYLGSIYIISIFIHRLRFVRDSLPVLEIYNIRNMNYRFLGLAVEFRNAITISNKVFPFFWIG